MKKIIFLVQLLFLFSNIVSSQGLEPFNGSYEKKYNLENLKLEYTYQRNEQTHNYSNNWDFDGDKITDQLYFIGNGGAHLYFHLKIILSSNNKTYDLDFIQLDMPSLGKFDELKNQPLKDFITEFIIHDFDSDKLNDIYVNFDDDFSSIPCKWKKKGIDSRHLVLNFNKGKLNIKNYTTEN